jgi:hypothetical protein
MTRDIFSRAAIASLVAEARQPSESLHNWRRLFPNARAKAIPLREIDSTAQVPTEILTSSLAIARKGAALPNARNAYPESQSCKPERYRPHTSDAAVALRLLKSVPAPLSVERVSRALAWPRQKARRWIERFAAKGELVATGKGHVWRTR